jgi:uncharacterized protein YqeY
MSLLEKISGDIKAAMLAREKEKLAALRSIKSELLLEATKDSSGEVSEDAGDKILQKLYKQRKDAGQLYIEQGRKDLADDEVFQAGIIEEYLPKQMNEDEIKAEVVAAIDSLGASSPSDMGKVMGVLTQKLVGKADGKVISKLVREGLQK